MKRKLIAGGAAAALTFAVGTPVFSDEATAPGPNPTTISVQYSGSVLVFQVANIGISASFREGNYSATSRTRAAGLASFFTSFDIESQVSGYNNGNGLEPWRYTHRNHAGNRNRLVQIDFPNGVATPNINPPFGSMGEPPASDAERTGAVDPVSGILSLVTAQSSTNGEPCTGELPIFDGKTRYNLRLEAGDVERVRTRAWRGDALVCRLWYVPVSGYDEGDRPSQRDLNEPIVMWLAPFDGGLHVPVRLRANVRYGGVTVEARNIAVE